jgi:hypothetical protein
LGPTRLLLLFEIHMKFVSVLYIHVYSNKIWLNKHRLCFINIMYWAGTRFRTIPVSGQVLLRLNFGFIDDDRYCMSWRCLVWLFEKINFLPSWYIIKILWGYLTCVLKTALYPFGACNLFCACAIFCLFRDIILGSN